MVREELAKRLKYFRELNEMTIYEVGNMVGKSGKTISAWETGRGQPDADMLITLCRLYKIKSIAELYGEDAPTLNVEEKSLLNLFRSLDADGRKKLMDRADELQMLGYVKQETQRRPRSS